MSLFEELIEDESKNNKIVKSLKPKKELSPDIFEKKGNTYVMKPDIRKKLLEISNDFIDTFGVKFFIHDIILTGSLANYNWSKYSDIDLHILLDMDEFGEESGDEILLRRIFNEFFNAKKVIWNKKRDIKVKGYDVEVYVQDIQEKHVSSGTYSILHNNWIIEPEIKNPKIDDRKILEKAEDVSNKIDKILNINNKDKALSAIETFKEKLKKFRKCGLDEGGEYSYENLTFKLLRRNGEIERLLDFKNGLVNDRLSLNESPDNVYVDGESKAHWGDSDGLPFGIYEDEMIIGFNMLLIPDNLLNKLKSYFVVHNNNAPIMHYRPSMIFDEEGSTHPYIPPFYEMLRRLGIEEKKLDFDKNRTLVGYWRTMFKYAGRLWFNKKIISFWEYPEDKEKLIEILNRLRKKIKNIYNVDIDFNEYSIEILRKEGEIFDDDNEYELIPIKKYISSGKLSKEKLEAPHLQSPEEKENNPQLQAVKRKNIERDAEIENKWGSLAKKDFILKKDIAELFLKESPDTVYGKDDNEIAHFRDGDAISFGYYKGEMILGYNKKLLPDNLESKIFVEYGLQQAEIFGVNIEELLFDGSSKHYENLAFYQVLHELGVEEKDLDLYTKYEQIGDYFDRKYFDFPGRLWFNIKLISFWKYPENINQLLKILSDINEKMKKIYNTEINFGDYNIEIVKGDESDIINITDYIKSKHQPKEKLTKLHLLSPEEKAKTTQMQDVKKSNIDFDSKKEEGWGNLAKRNFILNKDIAEMDD